MDTKNKLILKKNTMGAPSIYDFVDMKNIRKFLVYHPKLLLLLEILLNHIDDYMNHRLPDDIIRMNNSSHI